jgi:hypothetical protein
MPQHLKLRPFPQLLLAAFSNYWSPRVTPRSLGPDLPVAGSTEVGPVELANDICIVAQPIDCIPVYCGA